MDYKKFATSWGIKDDDTTRGRIIRHNWDAPGQYSSRLLLGIGEVDIAKQMALRAVIDFDNYAIPLAQLLEEIDDGTQMSQDELNELVMNHIQGFSHFSHNVTNLKQSNFRGKAVDALIKLLCIKSAMADADAWSVFIDAPESFLYDPALYNELTERFPELVKAERYRALYEQGNYSQLLHEFPEQKIGTEVQVSKESFQDPFFYDKEILEAQWENQKKYFDDRLWFARKLVTCHEACQACPEYQCAKTEEIMIGVRTLVQKLIEEQPQKEGQ